LPDSALSAAFARYCFAVNIRCSLHTRRADVYSTG
jgi:hypothetical protein